MPVMFIPGACSGLDNNEACLAGSLSIVKVPLLGSAVPVIILEKDNHTDDSIFLNGDK